MNMVAKRLVDTVMEGCKSLIQVFDESMEQKRCHNKAILVSESLPLG